MRFFHIESGLRRSGPAREPFEPYLRSGTRHPGFPEDVFVTAAPAELYRVIVGQQSLQGALAEGTVRVEGPPAFVRSLPRWFVFRAAGPAVPAASSNR